MKLSLVIPAYNAASYIARCLDSIQQQAAPFSNEIEVLVINDGSTDQTESIVRRYGACNAFIQLYTQSQQGAWSARNRGILLSRGEFIWFVDADDTLGKDAIRTFFTRTATDDADIFLLGFDTVGSDRVLIESSDELQSEWTASRIKFRREIWNKIYRKAFIMQCRVLFDELRYNEDTLFNFKLFCHNPVTVGLSECRYCYHVNPGSLMTSEGQDRKKFESSFRFVEEASRYLRSLPADPFGRQNSLKAILLDECDEHILGYLVRTRSVDLCRPAIARLKENNLYPTQIRHLNPISYLLNVEPLLYLLVKQEAVFSFLNLLLRLRFLGKVPENPIKKSISAIKKANQTRRHLLKPDFIFKKRH